MIPTIDPEPVNAWYGPQNALLTVLMLSGFDGVTKPALAVRAVNKQGPKAARQR